MSSWRRTISSSAHWPAMRIWRGIGLVQHACADAGARGRDHRPLCDPPARDASAAASPMPTLRLSCRWLRSRSMRASRSPAPSGRRLVPAAEFFVSIFTTALQPRRTADGGAHTAARQPQDRREGWGFRLFARRAGDFALVLVACSLVETGESHRMPHGWQSAASARRPCGRRRGRRPELAIPNGSPVRPCGGRSGRDRGERAHIGRVPPRAAGGMYARTRSAMRWSAAVSEVQTVPVTLRVNGEEQRVLVEPRKLLSDTLREDCDLTGTHVGCEHGVCGACTVLVDGRPVRSCLIYAVQMAGRAITTIEGVAPTGSCRPCSRPCTRRTGCNAASARPGIVLTMEAWLAENPAPSEAEIREALSGQSVPLHRLSQHRRGDRQAAARLRRGKGRRMSKPVDRPAAAAQGGPPLPDRARAAISTTSWCPGALHAHFVRSPHAHARIRRDRHRGGRRAARRRARRHRARARQWTTSLRMAPADPGPASGRDDHAADRQGALHRRSGGLHRRHRPLPRRGRRRAGRGRVRGARRGRRHDQGAGARRRAGRRDACLQPDLASDLHGRRSGAALRRGAGRRRGRRSTSTARRTRRSRRAAAAPSGTRGGGTSPCTSATRCRIPTAPSSRAGCA